MFKNIGYDRQIALDYAEQWALSRNPKYLNFDGMGGDCTNFVSQCLYAGCGIMNYTPQVGWFYISSANRAAAWTGVKYLHQFLIRNASNQNSPGPYAEETDSTKMEIGDIIQLGDNSGHFYHSLIVTGEDSSGLLVSTHTFDALNRSLNSYFYQKIRYLHIVGCRKWV